jgi:hypothetical protein
MKGKMSSTHYLVFLLFFAAIQIYCFSDVYARMGGGGMGGGGMGGGGRSIFDGLPTEKDCRNCHDDLQSFPSLEISNIDKHHTLLGSEILLPTAPPDAILGETYECISCHAIIWDPDIQSYSVGLYRDCLICHAIETVTGSPMGGNNRHHQLGLSCNLCHGGGMGGGR